MSSAAPSRSTFLILGGCGFIGRHLVKHLVDNGLAAKITVADKALPATAYLSAEHKAAFDAKHIVEFRQADLSKDVHAEKLFKPAPLPAAAASSPSSSYSSSAAAAASASSSSSKSEAKTGDVPVYDYIVNLCGETRCGMKEDEYKAKIVDVSAKVVKALKGSAPASAGLKRWVEVSTAQVYAADKNPSKEDGKLKPWTLIAKFRLESEQLLQAAKIPLVVLRPAYVYGPGDLTSLTPRISCAAAYQALGEKMRFLWDKDLRYNTVHVLDVIDAIVAMCTPGSAGGAVSVYNLADQMNVTQGMIGEWLAQLFAIDVSFLGTMMSTVARTMLSSVADDANEKHVPAFTKLCAEHKVLLTPVSPYIDKELLYDHHLSVDGGKICKEIKFMYRRQASKAFIKEQIEKAIQQGIFPKVLKG